MRPFRLFQFVVLILAGSAGAGLAQNTVPTVVDQTVSALINSTLSVPAPGVLAGATDVDDDPLTAFLVAATSGFVVNIETNGAFDFTPPAGFVGTNTFTFAATDGLATSAVATVTVIVAGPVAVNDNYTVAEDDTLSVPAPGVLGNDTSTLPNPITAVLIAPPTHGTVVLNPDGSFTYQPAADYHSGDFFIFPDTFQYRAVDGLATSATATVFIRVTPIDGAGDVNLYVDSLQFKQLRNARNLDQLTIRGRINPRGAQTDLTGATFALALNGQPAGIPALLDLKGRGSSLSESGVLVQARFNAATGAYSAKLRGLDLTGLALRNVTGLDLTALEATVTIAGAGLAIPSAAGVLTPRVATLADQYTKGLFRFRFYETLTGAFASHKTTATEIAGDFRVSFAGPFAAEGAATNTPTDGIRITIGNHVINVASNLVAGRAEFAIKAGPVADVTQFAISLPQKSFRLSTAAIPATGIPLAGSTNLTYPLPLLIEIPTTQGTNFYETIIELQRRDARSTKWSR